jgi:hypothetical protein
LEAREGIFEFYLGEAPSTNIQAPEKFQEPSSKKMRVG